MRKVLLVACMFIVAGQLSAQRQLAFPGAEGFGKYASGGRMGQVYHVTNLDDSGPGSLRDAVSGERRIVVFDVGGVIELKSPLTFSPNLTIAGQTAPGDGITVSGNTVSFTGADNLICRYIRFRLGIDAPRGADAVSIATGHNMIFDHVSAAWGKDETFSISLMAVVGGPSNITLQNSIVGQGIGEHSMGGLIHSDGGITLYRNLYIDNRSRNVKGKGTGQFVNNVVYNWEVGAYILSGNSEFSSFVNIEDNYFICGPDTNSAPFTRGGESFTLYARGNYVDDNLDGKLNGRPVKKNEYDVVTWQKKPFHDFPAIPRMSAKEAYRWIVDNAGCTFPVRDQVDAYMIDELKSAGLRGKILDSEKELPFATPGTIRSGTPAVDTDRDGMADEWEKAHGLDPADPKDGRPYGLSRHYTNVELYLNSLVEN